MGRNPIEVWAELKVRIWPEKYYLIDIAGADMHLALRAIEKSEGSYASVIRDGTGFSLFVDAQTWAEIGGQKAERVKYGPLRVISTEGDLPFDVTGFIGAALAPVNGQGFKAAPVCGLKADHFFTSDEHIEAVAAIFEKFTAGVVWG